VPRQIGTIAYSPEPATGELRLRLAVHSEIPEDAALREQWNALVQRLDRPQVFYTWEWALAVQRAYGATLHPLLFLAYDERESLCGVAALATDPEQTQATFLAATTGDYCDFLSSRQDKPAFVAGVLSELRKCGIDDIVLTNLPADSGSVEAIERACASVRYHFFSRTAYICAQVSLAHLERKPGENRPVLPRKKMLRRFLNAMGRTAPVRLDHAQSWASVEPVLPEFIRLHVARFLVTGLISNLARPERQRFLRELAKLLSETGWLALTRMISGENAYAWNYGFQFHDTWFWYQPTFDSALEKYSPGFCLLAKVIEEAADNPAFKFVDLGLGAEEYKDRFSNQSRKTLYVTLKTSAARHFREIGRYYATQAIRAVPSAEAAARNLRRRWHDSREHQKRDGVAATLVRTGKRVRDLLFSEREVFFYEWSGDAMPHTRSFELQELDMNALADATMQYIDDDSTLTYLLRAAARLGKGDAEGFGLVDAEGRFVHFTWVTGFEEFFLSELNAKVDAPSPECVLLFDCWTPPGARGNRYYGLAATLVARRMQEREKKPWIFSAAGNIASIHGLKRAGFQQRYSLVCHRTFGRQRIERRATPVTEARTTEVSAHVS
jgi:CelD/BcsL family acetyltransferase involved in cellulose biosynthesis